MVFQPLPGTTRGEVARYMVSLSTELTTMAVRRSRRAPPQAQPWFCVTRKNLFKTLGQGRYLRDEQKLVSGQQLDVTELGGLRRHDVAQQRLGRRFKCRLREQPIRHHLLNHQNRP
jgi:hypothetical protein